MIDLVDEAWKEFWVGNVWGGEPTMDEIKLELYDFYVVMKEVSRVYEHITNGRLTKINTLADAIIAEFDDIWMMKEDCREYKEWDKYDGVYE